MSESEGALMQYGMVTVKCKAQAHNLSKQETKMTLQFQSVSAFPERMLKIYQVAGICHWNPAA